MKQRLLFEGELSDPELDKVLPKLISKAIETEQDVYVRWNGVTLIAASLVQMDATRQDLHNVMAHLEEYAAKKVELRKAEKKPATECDENVITN